MRKFLALTMALATLNLSVFAATPLTRGTMLNVKIGSAINSKHKNTPAAYVDIDVRNAQGIVIIKRGTPVETAVTRKKARGCGRAGEITVKCLYTTAVDGQTIMLQGEMSEEGQQRIGLAIGLGVGLGLFFLPLVSLLAIKGKQAVVEADTTIPNVMVTNDYLIAE